jgi:hypothetical protein
MGYCIKQRGCQFTIKCDKKREALEAAKNLTDVASTEGRGAGRVNGQVYHCFAWMHGVDLQAALSLEEMLTWWRWQPSISANGDITKVQFNGEKAGDDEYLWKAIAPFVEPDSFIEMQGEDGAMWRWKFDGESVQRVNATVRWP